MLFALFLLLPAVFLQHVFAQSAGSGTADISISISTPPPQLSLSANADELQVHWHWDFISLGYYPPPITEVRVEISTDGLNYGNLQVLDVDDFVAIYSGLANGTYTAQVTIVDGNDYDYIVGPVTVSAAGPSGSSGGGRRNQPPDNNTDLVINGFAYPGPSTVVIFTYEGGFETTINPNTSGSFTYQTNTLPVGTGTFSFSAQDPNNVLSTPVTFDYDLPANAPVVINNVYLPPTIRISSSVVTLGEVMIVSGYGYANGNISLDVDGPSSRAYLVQVASSGAWQVNIDTADLVAGTYNISAQSTSEDGGFISPLSETLLFELVLPLPTAPVCGDGITETPEQCDDGNALNGDGCSSICQSEAGLPQSRVDQPSPSVFQDSTINLTYTASSPNGTIDLIEVYYSRNGSSYVAYPASFINGVIELTGLLDGDYEVYSIAHDSTGGIETAPQEPDATFTIDQVVAFNIIAYPEKRSPPQGNWSLASLLTLYRPGSTDPEYSYDLVTDAQGRHEIEASEVALGNYHFLLKGGSHLSKRLSDINFTGTDLVLDYTLGGTSFLLGGDVHPSKDDYINGLDLSSIIPRLYTAFVDADLNFDGTVNGMDLSIAVTNLFKRGDGA